MIDPVNELRKRMNGHTQEEMAVALGISQSEISHCLTGKRPPSKALLAKLGLEMRVKREYVRAIGAAGTNGKDRKRPSR
jgi:transcriptional regulator with XRE-family HTH domain